MRQIVLDIETTGLFVDEKHRIIEICCLEILNRKITGKKFHTYLNPQRKIDAVASRITGIKDFFLINKPLFKDIVDDLLDFIIGCELIIHNAKFDISFINYELSLLNHNIKDIRNHVVIFDTLIYSRKLYPGKKNNLDSLAKRCNINMNRRYHGALLDVIILARIYFIITMLQAEISLFDSKKKIFVDSEIINDDPVIIKKYADYEDKLEHVNFVNYIEKKFYKE